MAYSGTVTDKTNLGNSILKWGTYNCASVSTGELDPGSDRVLFVFLQPKASSVIATGSSIDETMPYSIPPSGASKVTIDTSASETGYWVAICKP